MVAEKAADLILGNTPLPPEHTPFYRHVPGAATPAATAAVAG
jgi:choline dehydrogenase